MRNSLKLKQQLRDAIEQEIATRTAVHQQKVAALNAAGMHSASAEAPLLFLAQGDSWFDYPLVGNGPLIGNTDIIEHLKGMGSVPPLIHNLAHFGESTIDSLATSKQERMIAALSDPANWLDRGKPDAILFSGGGNNIAGDQFCIFLNYNTPGAPELNATRLNFALGMVEASYLDLFAFRDRYAPDVPIFAHSYTFPFVTGIHPLCFGPWLSPSVQFCGWTDAQGTDMVRNALVAMKNCLQTLANDPGNNFHLIDTQTVLIPPAMWANELHPQPDGFQLIANEFLSGLRNYQPFYGRI